MALKSTTQRSLSTTNDWPLRVDFGTALESLPCSS